MKCCVLGDGIPPSNVIAAHIIRREFEPLSDRFFGLSVRDVRNGLLLYKPLEDAADQGRLVFLWNGVRYFCRVLDPDLKSVSLVAKARELLQGKFEPPSQAIQDLSFGDVDGRSLDLSMAQSPPLRRALGCLALISLSAAARLGWCREEEIDPIVQEMLSEGDYKENVRIWLENLSLPPPETGSSLTDEEE